MSKNNVTLVILDGMGKGEEESSNAIFKAKTPNIDKLFSICPTADLEASGVGVGLPENQMSNSQISHLNLGAGRIVDQDLTRINKSIEDGDFFSIPELVDAIEECKENNKNLHLIGMVSDAGVHSHERHLHALLELAKRRGIDKNVFIHCILDGRDTIQTSGEMYLHNLEDKIKEKGIGKIATVMGRDYAMDKKKNWSKIKLAYDAIMDGIGYKDRSVEQFIERCYQEESFDEFVEPTVFYSKDEPIAKVEDGDLVIFFNYRADRMRELSESIINPKFKEFETKNVKVKYVCMTKYDEFIDDKCVAFHGKEIKNSLTEVISKENLYQLKITEEERFKHLSELFNGNNKEEFKNEERMLVKNPYSNNIFEHPEMAANKITDKLIEKMKENKYSFMVVNYPNADILAHTGDISSTVSAIESIDNCLGKLMEAADENNNVLVITGDHGNAEVMIDSKTGDTITSNTTNPVKIAVYGMNDISLDNGKISDVAPTVLDILEIDKPEEMTGNSLIKRV